MYRPEAESDDGEIIIALPVFDSDHFETREDAKEDHQHAYGILNPRLLLRRESHDTTGSPSAMWN
jgi:hypothetical protein